MPGRIVKWLDLRLGLSGMLSAFLDRKVPKGINWAYTLGSATTTCFLVMVISGMLLTTHYQAAPGAAHESVKYIDQHVLLGQFIRNLHHWGASAMVVLICAHMTRVFYWGAYKFPRELTWITGALLLVLTLAFAFTGYLLPWDQKAYWTTVLLARMAETAPYVGEWARILIQGGHEIGSYTLTRFYSFHVILLPVATVLFVSVHIFLVVRQGISEPPRRGAEPYAEDPSPQEAYLKHYAAEKESGKPFYMSLAEDALISFGLVAALFLAAWFWPAPLEEPANPVAAGYNPRPEWYFLWLFQLLRYFPGDLEALGVIGVPLLIGGTLLFVPLLDRGPRRHLTRRPMTVGVWTLAGVAILWLTYAGATQQPVTGAPGSEKPPVKAELSPQSLKGWTSFQTYGCASCHRVGPVGNDVGPDLTHVGSRRPTDWMRKWVRDPQAIKPGVAMPPFPQIPDAEYDALIQFLSELK